MGAREDIPFEETWFHAPVNAVGDRLSLPETEAFHFQTVLRLTPGRPIWVSNGEGGVFLCRTHSMGKSVEIEAAAVRPGLSAAGPPAPPGVHLVLGLLKGRDLEEPVEGLCQLAVASISLVITEHTQAFKGQDHARLLERLRAKSLAALKQAKKSWLTSIHPPIPLREWRLGHPGDPLILVHPGPDRLPGARPSRFHVLTGPEGGFSGPETAWLMEEQACHTLGLGETRIRGTHAPLVACGKLMGLGWM